MRSPEIETVSPSMMIGVSEAPQVLATRATACSWYRPFALPAVVCKPRTIQAPRPFVAARVTHFQQTGLYVHQQIPTGPPIASREVRVTWLAHGTLGAFQLCSLSPST